MKFGDVVTAATSIVVTSILLDSLLSVAFARAFPEGADVAGVLSVLVASLIVGYVFAGQIQESRLGSIGRIAVLSTVLLMFGTIIAFAANGYYSSVVQQALQDMYSTSGWTTTDWYAYSQMALVMMVALNVVLALVLTFVGLYAGSMLKRGAKK